MARLIFLRNYRNLILEQKIAEIILKEFNLRMRGLDSKIKILQDSLKFSK